jgi:hypothetical protein
MENNSELRAALLDAAKVISDQADIIVELQRKRYV